MPDLIFEIGTEELPADVINPALNWMQENVAKDLFDLKLSFDKVICHGTPRRLVLAVEKLSEKQLDTSSEITGPKAEIAWDKNNQLTKAGLGFLKSNNIDPAKAYKKQLKNKQVIAAISNKKGLAASTLLPAYLEELIARIPFPKTMKIKSNSNIKFCRPISWILCLFGDKVFHMNFANLKSSNKTYGHRFLAPEPILVNNYQSYKEQLEKNYVMLPNDYREEVIKDEAIKLAKSKNGVIIDSDNLIRTISNLVEYPWMLLGNFDKKYLEIPKEILISEMVQHQKYLPVADKDGYLLPYFIVAIGSKPENDNFATEGHQRVLTARFEDGSFYYAKDCETSLLDKVKYLNKIIYEQNLGSVMDKVSRVQKLAEFVADWASIDAADKNHLLRAALLSKADLVSGVVGEFPHLQGTMGKIYALHDQEDIAVADAIEQHYWPKFSHDKLPSSKIATILAISDKIDTLIGIIGIGKIPKGSTDPFGLRRAAIGAAKIIINNNMSISISELVEKSIKIHADKITIGANKTKELTLEFLHHRIKSVLIDQLSNHKKSFTSTDLINGAMASGFDNLADLAARILALNNMRTSNSDTFASLTASFKRVGNIIKKSYSATCEILDETIKENFLLENSEKILLGAVISLQQPEYQTKQTLEQRIDSYSQYLSKIASVKPLVDDFFDNIMVMCEDLDIRHARLNLLKLLNKKLLAIADFTHIQ